MVIYVCLAEETAQKDVWRCAVKVPGALCVMTSGITPMLKWCATSWDFLVQVRVVFMMLIYVYRARFDIFRKYAIYS